MAKHNTKLEKYRAYLLNRIATTMYKVWLDDLEDFLSDCKDLNIRVDTSHLDYDGCITIEDNLGIEVIED